MKIQTGADKKLFSSQAIDKKNNCSKRIKVLKIILKFNEPPIGKGTRLIYNSIYILQTVNLGKFNKFILCFSDYPNLEYWSLLRMKNKLSI